jgi:hypothetical protein
MCELKTIECPIIHISKKKMHSKLCLNLIFLAYPKSQKPVNTANSFVYFFKTVDKCDGTKK